MTPTPTSIVIDIVFIPVFVILAIAAVVDVLRHGRGKVAGFIQLLIFCLTRLVGNALLAGACVSHSTNTGLYIAGFLLKGSGYSFLLTSALSLYTRASQVEADGLIAQSRTPAGWLKTMSFVALILLITGYNGYDGLKTSTSSDLSKADPLPTTAKAGDILFLLATIGLGLLLAAGLFKPTKQLKNRGKGESGLLIRFLALATPFLLVRIVYSTYLAFSQHPLAGNTWAGLICLNICEVIATALLLAVGFFVERVKPAEVEESTEAGLPAYDATYGSHGPQDKA